ncbi:hypothetical protein HJC23_012218 [Cyclotella cryptica]|uniref:CDP-diacylglycerol--inositol 3-phosphatidyltransferase n=1 Tax=Cyclotella cryptica TaxID=29204 RepID=A0ABD3P588_9STRA
MTNQTTTTPTAILLYIPNLIGYLRILCTLTSLFLMICHPTHYWTAAALYVSSFVGDLFDGMAARKFHQCSTFGGLMDMVTDRCATTGLLCVLIQQWAHRSGYVLVSVVVGERLFTLLIILDISSHWCQMYSTTSQNSHHKSAEGNRGRFFLVRWYYSSYPFFGYCCVGAEFTYVTIYILSSLHLYDLSDAEDDNSRGGWYSVVKTVGEYFLFVLVPACAVKQIVNVSQLCSSCYAVAERDAALKNQ